MRELLQSLVTQAFIIGEIGKSNLRTTNNQDLQITFRAVTFYSTDPACRIGVLEPLELGKGEIKIQLDLSKYEAKLAAASITSFRCCLPPPVTESQATGDSLCDEKGWK